MSESVNEWEFESFIAIFVITIPATLLQCTAVSWIFVARRLASELTADFFFIFYAFYRPSLSLSLSFLSPIFIFIFFIAHLYPYLFLSPIWKAFIIFHFTYPFSSQKSRIIKPFLEGGCPLSMRVIPLQILQPCNPTNAMVAIKLKFREKYFIINLRVGLTQLAKANCSTTHIEYRLVGAKFLWEVLDTIGSLAATNLVAARE